MYFYMFISLHGAASLLISLELNVKLVCINIVPRERKQRFNITKTCPNSTQIYKSDAKIGKQRFF